LRYRGRWTASSGRADWPQFACGAEYLAVGQPSVVVDDAAFVVLQLYDEVSIVLDPADDEDVRPHAGNFNRHDLIDLSAADVGLHAQLVVWTESEPWHERVEHTVEAASNE